MSDLAQQTSTKFKLIVQIMLQYSLLYTIIYLSTSTLLVKGKLVILNNVLWRVGGTSRETLGQILGQDGCTETYAVPFFSESCTIFCH